MPGPNVVLTFAGDSKQLEGAFDRVGQGARSMGREVEQAGDGFDRVGEAADSVDTRAMGFRDTLTGVQDGFAGLKKVTSGDVGFESLLLLGFGIGDLASGMFNFLIPAAKSAVTWLRGLNLATIASATWSKIAAAGARVWAAGQWLLNAALTANPIGLVVVGIMLLVGVIVLIATKTTWFQTAWKWVWSKIGDPVKAAWAWIKDTSGKALSWLLGLPGKIKSGFARAGEFVSRPFRAGFNMISRAWNNTVGRLSWTVPSWVPVVGGNTISVPKLPSFHTGGIVPGPPGREVVSVLQAGERVEPIRGGRSGAGVVVQFVGDGTRAGDLLVELLRGAVSVRGGVVQDVIGRAGRAWGTA